MALGHALTLAGALFLQPDECEFIESWSFNSNKCFATFMP